MHTEELSCRMHNGEKYTKLDQLIFQLLLTMACISASRPPMNIIKELKRISEIIKKKYSDKFSNFTFFEYNNLFFLLQDVDKTVCNFPDSYQVYPAYKYAFLVIIFDSNTKWNGTIKWNALIESTCLYLHSPCLWMMKDTFLLYASKISKLDEWNIQVQHLGYEAAMCAYVFRMSVYHSVSANGGNPKPTNMTLNKNWQKKMLDIAIFVDKKLE